MSERRATLVHNQKAGDKRHDRAALVQLLERGGYTVSYFATKECDLGEALGQPAEIIVPAGGDGMVARVVAHARSDGPPIAILPLGTANNIANSLEMTVPRRSRCQLAGCSGPPLLPAERQRSLGRSTTYRGDRVRCLRTGDIRIATQAARQTRPRADRQNRYGRTAGEPGNQH